MDTPVTVFRVLGGFFVVLTGIRLSSLPIDLWVVHGMLTAIYFELAAQGFQRKV